MNIQKYTGTNEQDIMRKIKEELGSSAIILNVKTIKSNWFTKLLKKDTVEITAAMDQDYVAHQAQKNEADLLIKKLMEHIDETYDKPNMTETLEKSTDTSKTKIKTLIYDHLIAQEVEPDLAMNLLEGTNELNDRCDIQDVIRVVYHNVVKIIGKPDTMDSIEDTIPSPKIVFFIGPTGVGKTTSIAKLTADFTLRKNKKVSLITADTYRIAAIDQLRTYAEILSVSIKVIYSPKELVEGIKGFKDSDFIFIDTAGRSHKNNEQLNELKEMLHMFSDKKVYLVLSATTKFKDVMSIAKKYSDICDKYAIIITKTDETTSVGTILNLKYYMNKPLAYISFGQNVPDDIETINASKYAKMLLGSLNDE